MKIYEIFLLQNELNVKSCLKTFQKNQVYSKDESTYRKSIFFCANFKTSSLGIMVKV